MSNNCRIIYKFKLPIRTGFNNNNTRNILLQSLYVFIKLVNKKSQINMNEKLEIILVEADVLVFEALQIQRIYVCFCTV